MMNDESTHVYGVVSVKRVTDYPNTHTHLKITETIKSGICCILQY